MKKIVIQVVQHLAIGGIETLALNIQEHTNTEVEIHIVSLNGTKEEAIDNWPRLQATQHKLHFLNKPPRWSISCFWKLYLLYRKLKPIAVHTHHIGPLIYGGLIARITKVPNIIHTEHSVWHLQEKKTILLQQIAFNIINPTITAVAKIVADDLQKIFRNCKPKVIQNGVDVRKFIPGDTQLARQILNLPSDNILVGCSGRLEKIKGQHILLEALTRLPDNIHLVLVGNGSNKEFLKQKAIHLNFINRVIFLNNIDNMPHFYQAIDILCSPSLAEGLPLALLEGQASNKPVVATDVGANKEAICPTNGELIPPNNSKALADAILRKASTTLQNPKPRDYIIQKYNLSNSVSAYFKLYNK